jgi:hypothetical protein
MKLNMVGSDTEMFIAEKKTGKIIPGHPGLIPGTKEEPFLVGDCASMQLDNVLGEVTFPPCDGSGSWVTRVIDSRKEVARFLLAKGLKPVYCSSFNFKPRDLATQWGATLGCKPDHAADTSDPCVDVKAGDFPTLRSASGHIHISLREPATAHEIMQRVRVLDAMLAAPISMYNDGSERRTMYGRAGRFRFKPEYPGFEYRTLDNYWYGHFNVGQLDELYGIIHTAINHTWNKNYLDWLNAKHVDLCRAINVGNAEYIKSFLRESPFGHFSQPNKTAKKREINRLAPLTISDTSDSQDWAMDIADGHE